MDVRYYARSASDKTDDWPFWYVSDERGINVTRELERKRGDVGELCAALPFLPDWDAVKLAMWANRRHTEGQGQ